MVSNNESTCPYCGESLKYYDRVKRIVRTKGRITKHIKIRRFRCQGCCTIHREIPDFIFPYKQYESEIIIGVLEGIITYESLEYEDYPCEMTMMRWKSQKMLILANN